MFGGLRISNVVCPICGKTTEVSFGCGTRAYYVNGSEHTYNKALCWPCGGEFWFSQYDMGTMLISEDDETKLAWITNY